jgi:hypothetical protein
MSKLQLKLKGWGTENQPTESISVSTESKPISRSDGDEFGYRYVETTEYSQEKVFQILNDYLRPDTKTSLDSVVHSILALLPEKEPLSTAVWSVGEVVLQLAEQIPYHHPSQIKLARLMEELTRSPKFATELSELVSWHEEGFIPANIDTCRMYCTCAVSVSRLVTQCRPRRGHTARMAKSQRILCT